MGVRRMSDYSENSTEALWQLIALMGLADGKFTPDDEAQEAAWANAFVDNIFADHLSLGEKQKIVEFVVNRINALEEVKDYKGYVTEAARLITDGEKQKTALDVLKNVLLADGIIDEAETWLFATLCDIWQMDYQETYEAAPIPTLEVINKLKRP